MHFYTKINRSGSLIEGLTSGQRCPDVLIQKGDKFYLYNSKLAQVPGVNPIEFDNLEDYEYIKYTCNNKGICCNINHMYKVNDNATNLIIISNHNLKI